MNYYVVSPNVWNDGEIMSHIDFMCRSNVVCMGWDKDKKMDGSLPTVYRLVIV